MTDYRHGDRVLCAGFLPENQPATFLEYGPDSMACSPDHVVWPGLRIAFIASDAFGRMAAWENKLTSA
jgi:hypothetical protein